MSEPLQLRGRSAEAVLAFVGEVAGCRDEAELGAQIALLPQLIGADSVALAACREWANAFVIEQGDPSVYRAELLSSCCLVAHRAGRDFSERDRAVLAIVAPHVRAARARLRAEALVAERLALVEQALEGARRGVLILDVRGRLLAAGRTGRVLVERWFGGDALELPDELATWAAAARTDAGAELDLELDGRRLRARLIGARDESMIVLTERDDTVAAAAPRLARLLPITNREADVLARLAAGRTNDGIAHDLRISRHTVIRHVESVYAKLDVHTRAAATRMAMDVLRDDT
jgi:DNA-binding CsgD family transcriptional regulator